ncbi:MAG: pilus assembly protein [Methylobacteriaceae bacterium]|nr:pilus assembly protein [Methylobacteriaceae bacterium]
MLRFVRSQLFQRFTEDRKGNVAMIFGLSLIPMLGLVGAAVDYSRAAQVRAQLNSTADAAALAAVSKSGNPNLAPPSQAAAQKMFQSAVASMPYVTLGRVSLSSNYAASSLSVNVSYTASVQTSLMNVFGIPSITVSGSAGSTRQTPVYIDFYLLLDNSPSMGLAATTADISHLQALTPDACAFACHQHVFNSQGQPIGDDMNDYYHVAKNNGVTLRIDVLRMATQSLTTTATNTATVANQFRMGVYEFNSALQTISGLSANLATVASNANAIDLAYAYQNQSDNQTSYDIALPAINAIMTDPGDGSSASFPQKYLFFVTDGVEDEAVQPLPAPRPAGNVNSNRLINTINPAICTAIKDRGIKIALLYTTYLPVTNNAFYNQWVSPIASRIPTQLSACASPGFFFEVTPTEGISEAMTHMFEKAVSVARLTQ